jgi:hypothetical protein
MENEAAWGLGIEAEHNWAMKSGISISIRYWWWGESFTRRVRWGHVIYEWLPTNVFES